MVSIQKLWYTNLKSPKQNMAVLGFLGIKMLWILFWTKQKSGQSWIFFFGGWVNEMGGILIICLVVTGTMEFWMTFPSYWECHTPNWRTKIIFQRGWAETTNQLSLFERMVRIGKSTRIRIFLCLMLSEKNLVWKQVLLAPNVPHDFCPRDVIDFRRSISVSPRGFDHIWTRHWTSISKSSFSPQMKGTLNCPKPHPNGVCWNFLIVGICGTHRLATLYSSWAPGKKRREVAAWSWILSHFKGYIKLKPATTPNFNHWGVLFSIILYLGFMLVKKKHGVYHAGKEVVLTKPLDHSVFTVSFTVI